MTDVINENENNQALPEEEVDITVVDNGQTYESQESAIVAKDEADRAKLWAEESERQANLASASAITAVDAKDDAVAAKNYAESAVTDTNLITVATDLQATPSNIKTVANNITNVNTVANSISNVNSVASNISNVNAVAGNATNINAVNTNKNNINIVAGISSDVTSVASIASDITTVVGSTAIISTVANNIANVNNVGNDILKVNAVADDLRSINAVYDSLININTVARGLVDITEVAAISSDVSTVAGIALYITDVAAISNDILTVARNADNVRTVANNDTNISTVATNISDVSTVATNTSNIATVVANITDIQNAASNAAKARDWAVKMDGKIDGDDYSAKYYAAKAEAAAASVGDPANRDLSNLSAIGEAKFTAKQDVISDLATIRSGASAGATAVQPADLSPYALSANLATVATSGAYSDLSGTPNMADYVTLATDQTVTGNKTTSGDFMVSHSPVNDTGNLIYKNIDISARGATISSDLLHGIRFSANNGNSLSDFADYRYANGDSETLIRNYNNDNNGTAHSGKISIVWSKSAQNFYTYAPASDESNSIVTTINKTKASNGYYQLGNGLIVQWGTGTMAANATSGTVTLPKAFTSSSSYMAISQHQGSALTSAQSTIGSRAAASFVVNYNASYSGGARTFLWIAIGY